MRFRTENLKMRPKTKKLLRWILLYPVAVVVLLFFLPAPHSGYWHTPLSDCLCDSKNLLSFEKGTAYRWASAHGISRQPSGSYERGVYSIRWQTDDGVVLVTPGWLLVRVKMPQDRPYIGGKTYWGVRELRPGYIQGALNTKPLELHP